MTTPARIAAFLSTSALCLGLASSPSYADSRDADSTREAHSLTRDREPAKPDSAAEAAAPDDTAASGGQRARAR